MIRRAIRRVVRGAADGRHTTPVAGVANGNPQYLAGNLGDPLTTNAAQSGNYFSTDGAGSSVTITFTDAQESLALLWGSIDVGNQISYQTIDGGGQDVLTWHGSPGPGAELRQQWPSGRRWQRIRRHHRQHPFRRIVLSSASPPFEASALVGSDRAFVVSEPASSALFGVGLLGAGLLSRRRT